MLLIIIGFLVLASPLYFFGLVAAPLSLRTKIIAGAIGAFAVLILPVIYILVSHALGQAS